MERLTIQTHNFEPNDDQIDFFKATFGHALSRGPSDATLCCCLSRENGAYVLNMRIHSSHGHFPIHLQSRDLESLIQNTVSEMTNSFKEWHKDPDGYGKTHKMGEKPCYRADGSVYRCPLGFYSNKKFESKAHL